MSLRRSDVGSMPMSVAFCEANWSWLRRKKQTGTFNISEFVDRAVSREIALSDLRGSPDASMLDVLDREQLLTYARRVLMRLRESDGADGWDKWTDMIYHVRPESQNNEPPAE